MSYYGDDDHADFDDFDEEQAVSVDFEDEQRVQHVRAIFPCLNSFGEPAIYSVCHFLQTHEASLRDTAKRLLTWTGEGSSEPEKLLFDSAANRGPELYSAVLTAGSWQGAERLEQAEQLADELCEETLTFTLGTYSSLASEVLGAKPLADASELLRKRFYAIRDECKRRIRREHKTQCLVCSAWYKTAEHYDCPECLRVNATLMAPAPPVAEAQPDTEARAKLAAHAVTEDINAPGAELHSSAVAAGRTALLQAYKDEGRRLKIKITDEMVARSAKKTGNGRTPVARWKADDSRCTADDDRRIRKVLKEKPHLPEKN